MMKNKVADHLSVKSRESQEMWSPNAWRPEYHNRGDSGKSDNESWISFQHFAWHFEHNKGLPLWVLQLLTPVQKTRQTETAEMLQLCQPNPDDVFSRLVTMDVCWVYHYDHDIKEQIKQWKHVDSPLLKKVKTQPSSGKVILECFFFCDCHGTVLADYVRKEQTITGAYYRNLLKLW